MANLKENCIGKSRRNLSFSSGDFLFCFQSTKLSPEEFTAKWLFLKTYTVCENMLLSEKREEDIHALNVSLTVFRSNFFIQLEDQKNNL